MLTVAVAWSPAAGEACEMALEVPDGTTVLTALELAGLVGVEPGTDAAPPAVGVWGRRCEPARVLRPGDRVELYRPLTVDPMEARRRRQRAQMPTQRPTQRPT